MNDVIVYAGRVTMDGYHHLCGLLSQKVHEKVILVLATPGGDPDAGFRMARALQNTYSTFEVLVPRYCKSAGTLMAIGASKLYLGDLGELGPLDIQLKKDDEINGQNSGLSIFQAIDYLREQTMGAFSSYLGTMTQRGLSTKVASDIAARLTTGLFQPIASQIDPLKLAEIHRAMQITQAYGTRLAAKSENLHPNGLGQLVSGYPSHSFVIDREEAKTLFHRVERPDGLLLALNEEMLSLTHPFINAEPPFVQIFHRQLSVQIDESNADTSAVQKPTGAPGGDADLESEIVRSGERVSSTPGDAGAATKDAIPDDLSDAEHLAPKTRVLKPSGRTK